MPWGVVAGAVIGGVMSNRAADKGAKASTDATNASIQSQEKMFNQSRQDNLPFMQGGYDALARQRAILGGDLSGFQNSPDYKFNFDQGMQAMDRSAAARGGLYSGGHQADLMKFGQGLASTHLNDYWSKLAGMAGQGYNSTANVGSLGANMANQISGAQMQNGMNRASAYNQQGNNYAQMAGALGNAYTYYRSNR